MLLINLIKDFWRENLRPFPCFLQFDQMDCGPSTLAMIADYYGQKYAIQELREYCYFSKEGVSLIGIEDAARKIGFETLAVKPPIDKLVQKRPLPCILHWDNSHFVVLYDIKTSPISKKRIFYLSDPSFGRIKLNEDHFRTHWCGKDGVGVALLLTPTDDFKRRQPQKISTNYKTNLLAFIRRFKHEYTILFLGMLVSTLFTMIFPFLTQSLIDIGVKEKDVHVVFVFLLAELFLFLGTTIITIVRNWTLLYCNSILNIKIIHRFLSKIIKLPFKFFDTKQLSDFTARIADHGRIQDFLTSSSITVVFSIFYFIVYFILLAHYEPTILYVYVGITSFSVLWSLYYVEKERKMDYSRFRTQRDTQQYIYEIINGISEIKLNNTEDYKLSKWQESQIKLLDVDVKVLKLSQIEAVGYDFLNKIKDMLVVFLAACGVIEGQMTMGTLLAVSYIIGALDAPINQIIAFIRSLQYAKLSYDRLNEVQTAQNEDANSPAILKTIANVEGRYIRLSHVDFHYLGPRSPKVLDDITVNIPLGKTTAIVGESGSGKTTLMKILLKLYDSYDGDIFYDDINLHDLSAKSLRRQCGVVMQDGYIFSDTLARNIVTGDEPIDEERLNFAIQLANLQDVIKTVQYGKETMLGAAGNGISGGQKQRILIARAVYKNPSLFMFDEATSSLDATTENIIYHNLDEHLKGKTVIKIAHRLSTVKNADLILVLQKGRIVESGNHQSLINERGVYYNLVKNQLDLSV